MNDNIAALEVEGLTKRYPGFTLDRVSLRLMPGEILGLVGKNGAGKSTLLMSILGAIRPDAGSVTIFGKNAQIPGRTKTACDRGTNDNTKSVGSTRFDSLVSQIKSCFSPSARAIERKGSVSNSAARRAQETAVKSELGVVLGGIDFYLQKRVSEIADATQRFYSEWNADAYGEYLELFDIDPKKHIRELSSGMRVKFLIALALSHGARLFLFDEPTSGLDPVSRDEVLELFRLLVKSGERAVLFSTHITSDLEKCADSVAYLANGKLLAAASKTEFPKRFAHLASPGEPELSIEEIMIRTEKKRYESASL